MMTERAERADLFATIRAAAAIDGPCTLTYPQVNVLQRLLVQVFELLDDYRDKSLPPASPGAGGERVWRCYDKLMGRNEWTGDFDLVKERSGQPDEWVVTELINLQPAPAAAVADAERAVIDAAVAWTDGVSRESGLRQLDKLTDALDALDTARALASSAQKDGAGS